MNFSYKINDNYIVACRQERLGNEDSWKNVWDSLGRGNKREFVSALDAGGVGNKSAQVWWGQRRSAERDFGNGGTLGSGKILAQGNLPVT